MADSLYLQSAALENLWLPLMVVMGSLQFLWCECTDTLSMCATDGFVPYIYITVNGGIITSRGREVMSRGRVEENTVKWMCSGGEMTSPPLSPSLSHLDKMFPSKLCNFCMSLALHHCPSKTLTLSSLSSFSASCLIAFPLNHCNIAIPHFILVSIFQESTATPTTPETFMRVNIKGLVGPNNCSGA